MDKNTFLVLFHSHGETSVPTMRSSAAAAVAGTHWTPPAEMRSVAGLARLARTRVRSARSAAGSIRGSDPVHSSVRASPSYSARHAGQAAKCASSHSRSACVVSSSQ